MSDTKTKFHEFALQSSLFKGRSDWYFCFLKAERISQVCAVLADKASERDGRSLDDLRVLAALLPKGILYFVAGEAALAKVLADIFSLLLEIRMGAVCGSITRENADVLVGECELVAQKLSGEARFSSPLSLSDFSVEGFPVGASGAFAPSSLPSASQRDKASTFTTKSIKDGTAAYRQNATPGSAGRVAKIVDFITKNNTVSIKDIASFVRDCSEKTIQRELGVLIEQGVIKRTGERRWSQYSLR